MNDVVVKAIVSLRRKASDLEKDIAHANYETLAQLKYDQGVLNGYEVAISIMTGIIDDENI